jgi:hypothetical protein
MMNDFVMEITHDGDLFVMLDGQLLDDGMMFCYGWKYNNYDFELFYDTKNKCYAIIGCGYILRNIFKPLYYSFTMDELIKRNFPIELFEVQNNDDDFEDFEDVEWID